MSNGMEIQLIDVRQHQAVLNAQAERLDKWCTTGGVKADGLIRYALAEMEQNVDLRNCTPTSVYLALLACGVTGLVPGKLRGFAYLVPFNNKKKGGKDGREDIVVPEATFMMGWKGVKHIGYRAGLDMISVVVHKNDTFDYDVGTKRFVTYKPALEQSGPVIGTAAWAELPRGGLEVEYLNLDTLKKIQEAAERMRPSPAWRGAFADQMQRKSALKRLGKQIEMGEEFIKADAIELAQDEDGDARRALDEFTDGAASHFLTRQSAEAATFGHLPRPAQTQVPAQLPPAAAAVQAAIDEGKAASQGGSKLTAATDKARAADKKREDKARPTSAASTSSTSPADSSSPSPSGPQASTSSAASSSGPAPTPTSGSSGASPTTPASSTPAPSTATSQAPAASAASPAASSGPSSTTTPSPSTGSDKLETASGAAIENPLGDDAGDVAGEPALGDDFDTSFGEDASDDPVDRAPATRAEWVAAFNQWVAAHPTREEAVSDWGWLDIFRGWLALCESKAQMDAEKAAFTDWSVAMKFSRGRKADPAKGVTAIPADEQLVKMQGAFAEKYKAVP